MADDSDDRAIKTVKGISAEAWEKGLTAAKKRGEPFGLWLGSAILQVVNLQADDRVILPDERSPAPVGLPTSAPAVSLAEIETAMRAAKAIADASGVPVPKTAARHCYALLTRELRAARGLPQGRQRPRIGQTVPQINDLTQPKADNPH